MTRTAITKNVQTAARRMASLCGAALVIVAMFLGLIALPQPAHAQGVPVSADGAPTLSVSSHELAGAESFTARVAFNPGDYVIGAVSFGLVYDTASLEAQSCSASDVGICHLTPDGVRLAKVNTNGIGADTELLSVDFVSTTGAITPSELRVEISTLATIDGFRFEGGATIAGLVSAADAEPAAELAGGVNGEVLDTFGAGVFAAQVCAVSTAGSEACTETTGLGAFAIDGLESGDYRITISDPTGALAGATIDASVNAPDVTTGLSATLSPPDANDDSADDPGDDTISDDGTISNDAVSDDASADATNNDAAASPAVETASQPLTAGDGEIVIHVLDPDGTPVIGANACATVPVIRSQSCALTADDGVARLTDLAVSNYILSAEDRDFRFAPAETQFVGLNPGAGIVAELSLRDGELGDPPDALAYVNDAGTRTRATAITATALSFAVLTGVALATKRREVMHKQ